MQIEVVTLFPELVRDAVKFGVLGRALERGIVRVGCEDPRAHTRDVHRTVDDRPYGGGPGMVLKPEPMTAAIDAAAAQAAGGVAAGVSVGAGRAIHAGAGEGIFDAAGHGAGGGAIRGTRRAGHRIADR